MTRRIVGILGSILGSWFPGLALLAATPPLGWGAVGGREPLSLFLLEAWCPHPPRSNDALLLTDYPCPGNSSYVALLQAPLPEDAWALPNGIVACVLPAADGHAVTARIMDGEGRLLSAPGLVVAILSGWKFDTRLDSSVKPGWQRVRIDAWRATVQPLTM